MDINWHFIRKVLFLCPSLLKLEAKVVNKDKEITLMYLEEMHKKCVEEIKELSWGKYGVRLGLNDLRNSIAHVLKKIEESEYNFGSDKLHK